MSNSQAGAAGGPVAASASDRVGTPSDRREDTTDVSEELAAAIVVSILSARGTAIEPADPPAGQWANREDALRRQLSRGPEAWRFSLR